MAIDAVWPKDILEWSKYNLALIPAAASKMSSFSWSRLVFIIHTALNSRSSSKFIKVNDKLMDIFQAVLVY